MKNKYNTYSKEFDNYVREKAKVMKKEELYNHIIKKYNLNISKDSFQHYLLRRNIRCIDYDKTKATKMPKYQIGYERIRSNMTEIKIAQPNVWESKQRYLYKKYHNCDLTSDDYIIFLNQDRNDYSKDNLIKISRKESAMISGVRKLVSKDKELTKLGILIARLMLKAKEKQKC